MKRLVFCGIDLAAKEKNPTGAVCIDIKARVIEEGLLFSDHDILNFIRRNKPKVIAIDAPLSLPVTGNLREEERLLLSQGHKIFPFFESMTILANRGIHLDNEICKIFKSSTVIEVCPSVSAKILGIEREKNKVKRHLEDARIAAITAKMFYEGDCILVSGRFFMPRKEKN